MERRLPVPRSADRLSRERICKKLAGRQKENERPANAPTKGQNLAKDGHQIRFRLNSVFGQIHPGFISFGLVAFGQICFVGIVLSRRPQPRQATDTVARRGSGVRVDQPDSANQSKG